MENKDTILLLKECDSGSKMAVASIDEVLENVQSTSMKQLLSESKAHHEKLGNEIHSMLSEHQSEDKDQALWLKVCLDEDEYENGNGQQRCHRS